VRFSIDKLFELMSLLIEKFRIKTVERRTHKEAESLPKGWIDIDELKNNIVFVDGRRARIHWKPSKSQQVVGYKLYWAVGRSVDYHADFTEIGNVNEVILPDDIPSFSVFPMNTEIGVTAVDQNGSESDMTKCTVIFKFPSKEAEIFDNVIDMEKLECIGTEAEKRIGLERRTGECRRGRDRRNGFERRSTDPMRYEDYSPLTNT